jgi:hypothetical protein
MATEEAVSVRMRVRGMVGLGVAVVVFGMGACASLDTPDSRASEGAGKASPVPDASSSNSATPSPLVPSPAREATAQEKVLYSLYAKVIRQAGVAKATTGRCDSTVTGTSDQTVTCTVNYDGLDVPFTVEIHGGFWFTYTAKATKFVLVGDGVRARFADWAVRYAMPGSLRCDANLPDKKLLDPEEPTGYQCYYIDKPNRTTRAVRVKLSDSGVNFVWE